MCNYEGKNRSKKSGKTSFINKLISGIFSMTYKPTIGTEFYNYTPDLQTKTDVVCHIVDVGGKMLKSPKYMKIALFRTNIVFMFIDISNFEQSFDKVKKYYSFINKNRSSNGFANSPM